MAGNGVQREGKALKETIRGIAGQLVAEHKSGAKFHRLPGMGDLADAYRVQNDYITAIIGTDHAAGYKIGLTSKRMQQMCGIDQPIRGTIFSDRIIGSGAHLFEIEPVARGAKKHVHLMRYLPTRSVG